MVNAKIMIIAGLTSLALLGGSFAFGVHKGTVWQVQEFEKDRLALQEDLFDLGDSIREQNEQILKLNKEKEGLIHDLETQATNAAGSSNPGVGTTGGLRRLEERWSQGSTLAN